MPFGIEPLKIDNADPPNGAGAGAPKRSPVPTFVGWKVPLVRGPASGRAPAAASSSVNVRLVTPGFPPPTSDMMIAFCPLGPTSMTSTSSVNVCENVLRVTVTFVTVPPAPETTIFDGYGLALPLLGIVIEVVFDSATQKAGVGLGLGVGVGVGTIGVGEGVAVGTGVGVGVGVGVGAGVGVGVGVTPGVGVGVGVGVTPGVGVGVGVAVRHPPDPGAQMPGRRAAFNWRPAERLALLLENCVKAVPVFAACTPTVAEIPEANEPAPADA